MIHSDTVVIGRGLAGLVSALASAKKGRKVTLLSGGSGSLSLNSGTIDVLGYDDTRRFIPSPKAGIPQLPSAHPYHKIGLETVEESIRFFLDVTKEYGLPYHGSLDRQLRVPTGVGTMKPTCLTPASMDGSCLTRMKKIVVVGIAGCKDFYADIMAENIRKFLPQAEQWEVAEIQTGLTGGRDLMILDVARWLDTEEGRAQFTKQLKSYAGADTAFLVPQILGTEKAACAEDIRNRLASEVIETTCLPPSVNGLRLQKLLLTALRDRNVDIIEDTRVLRGICEGTVCKAVVTQASAREKTYYADKFILATGGFYGGGIAMREFEQPKEMIFDLPVWFPSGEENWSNEQLFSDRPQGYAMTGILTDDALCPVDGSGKRVFDNVHVVGRNLGGYDFCLEHSGNGVALASAYKAACV